MAKLYFYYASMNAGKSTTLLQADFNYRERGMETMLWTAALDDRFGAGAITSRIGLSTEAGKFDATTDIRAAISSEAAKRDLACVLVDEAQFLSRAQVLQLAAVADVEGIPVLCYGLRTDFKGELFPNLRVDAHGNAVKEGAQTEIGGNDRYVALCRKHFMEKVSG
jgi:thymidine kinase